MTTTNQVPANGSEQVVVPAGYALVDGKLRKLTKSGQPRRQRSDVGKARGPRKTKDVAQVG